MRNHTMKLLAFLCTSAALAAPVDAAVVYLDLGADAARGGPAPAGYESHLYSWNTVAPALNTTVNNLVDSTGANTGFGLVVSDQFKGTNGSGPLAPTGAAMEFWQGANDSLFLSRNNVAPPDELTGAFTLTNLDPGATYDFVFFGSNINPSVFNRFVVLTATGAAVTSTSEYDTVQHSSNVVGLNDIAPSAGGTIHIDMVFGPSAVGSYVYLNAVKMTETVPEPTSMALLCVGAAGLLVRRRR